MNSEVNKKDRDKDKILHTLQDMFIDVLDLDIIQSVAQNCDFHLHGSIEALMMLTEETSPKSSPLNNRVVAEAIQQQWHTIQESEAPIQRLFPMYVPELPLLPKEETASQETLQAENPPTVTVFNQPSIADSCPSQGSIKISYRGQNGCSSSDDDADVFIEDEQECEVLNPTAEGVSGFPMFENPFHQFMTHVLPTKAVSKQVQEQQKSYTNMKPPTIPPELPSMATAASKLKDIKMRPAVSKARNNSEHAQSVQLKIMQHLNPVEWIQKMILDRVPLMVLMRGVPGSGKTYLAKQLITTTLGHNKDFKCYIFSTDDFFALMNCNFNPEFLQQAHEWNRRRVHQAVIKRVSPIIVDNTNTQVWEMQPYAEIAIHGGYALELLEPNTPWRYQEAELYNRNVHGVSRPKIRAMLDRFEHNLTSKKLLEILGLKYYSRNKPNTMGKNADRVAKAKPTLQNTNEGQHISCSSSVKPKKIRSRRRKKKNKEPKKLNVPKLAEIPYLDHEKDTQCKESFILLSNKLEHANLNSNLLSGKCSDVTSLRMTNITNKLPIQDVSEINKNSISSEVGALDLCLSGDGQSLTDGSSSTESEEEEEDKKEGNKSERKRSDSSGISLAEISKLQITSQLEELFYSDDEKKLQIINERNIQKLQSNSCMDYVLVLPDSTLLPQRCYKTPEKEKQECWEYMIVLSDSTTIPQKSHETEMSQEFKKTEVSAHTQSDSQAQSNRTVDADTTCEMSVDTMLIDLTDVPIEKETDGTSQNHMTSYQFVPVCSILESSSSLIDTPLEDILINPSFSFSDKENNLASASEVDTNKNLLCGKIPPSSPSLELENVQMESNHNDKKINNFESCEFESGVDATSAPTISVLSVELDQWLSGIEDVPAEQKIHVNRSKCVAGQDNDTENLASSLLFAAQDSNDEEFLSAVSSNDSLTEDRFSQFPDVILQDTVLIQNKPKGISEMMKKEENSLVEEKEETLPEIKKTVENLPLINDLFHTITLENLPKHDFLSLVKQYEKKGNTKEKGTNVKKELANTIEQLNEEAGLEYHNEKTEDVEVELNYTENNINGDAVEHKCEENIKEDINTNFNDSAIPQYQEQNQTLNNEENMGNEALIHYHDENNWEKIKMSVINDDPAYTEVSLIRLESESAEHLNKGLADENCTLRNEKQMESEAVKIHLNKEVVFDGSTDTPLHLENGHKVILDRKELCENGDESVKFTKKNGDPISMMTNSIQEKAEPFNNTADRGMQEFTIQKWEKNGDNWQNGEREPKNSIDNTASKPKPARERRLLRKGNSPYRYKQVFLPQKQEPKFEEPFTPSEIEAWGAVPEPAQSWENNDKIVTGQWTKDKRSELPQPQRIIFASEIDTKKCLSEAAVEDMLAKEFHGKNEAGTSQISVAPISNTQNSDHESDNIIMKAEMFSSSKPVPSTENNFNDIENREHFVVTEACSLHPNNLAAQRVSSTKQEETLHSDTQLPNNFDENKNMEYSFPILDSETCKSASSKAEVKNVMDIKDEMSPLLMAESVKKTDEIRKINEEISPKIGIIDEFSLSLKLHSEKQNSKAKYNLPSAYENLRMNLDADNLEMINSSWQLEATTALVREEAQQDIGSASFHSPRQGMMTVSTNTHRDDFMILEQVERLGSPAGPMRDISVLHARSRSIDEGLNITPENAPLSAVPHVAKGVLTYDKSSMTNEEDRDFAAAMLASTHEQEANFNHLLSIFPTIDKDDLREIFDRCNGDLNWTADILLESGLEHFQGAASNSPPTHDIEAEDTAGLTTDLASEQGATGGILWWENVPMTTSSSHVQQESESNSVRDFEAGLNLSVHENQSLRRRFGNSLKNPTSEYSQKLKKELEERVVLNEQCYSDHTRRIWNLRHGQRQIEETTTGAPEMLNQNTVEQSWNEKAESDRNVPIVQQELDSLDKACDDKEEEEELVPFTVDAEFASQLQHLFGNVGAVPYAKDTFLDVKLPVSLARQIHSYLVETQHSLMEQQYREMQKMIREDEELARRLQEEEDEQETKISVPDVRVVMDMEMALELYRADQEEWKNGQGKDDLATKLSKRKLCEMFPNLDQDALLQLFTAHNNSFEETVNEIIVSVDGLRDTEAVRNVLAPEALAAVERNLIEQARQESLKFAENTPKPLPIVVVRGPGEARYQDPQEQAKADAEHYRTEASRHQHLRSECVNKAHEAYRKGMKSVASYYSQMASLHRQRIDEANARAASSLVTAHTLAQNSTTLDLHFLLVVEALQVLDMFLDHHIVNLANANRSFEYLFLITGRGLRSSGGRSRIRPAVERRLEQRGLKWLDVNPGMLKVMVTQNSVLAYSSVSTTL